MWKKNAEFLPLYAGRKSPELEKFLDLTDSKVAREMTKGESYEEWSKQIYGLKANLGAELHNYLQARNAWLLGDHEICDPDEFSSPSGKYRYVTTYHPSMCKATIYRGDTEIATVIRNFDYFWSCWVEDHPTGCDYLVCGEDYQGQTVVNLTTGEVKSYLPINAYLGCGFCYTWASPSPDKNRLVVFGCVWACPYQTLVVEFSDPMNMPWPIYQIREDDFEPTGFDNDTRIKGVDSNDVDKVVDVPPLPEWARQQAETWVPFFRDTKNVQRDFTLVFDQTWRRLSQREQNALLVESEDVRTAVRWRTTPHDFWIGGDVENDT